ncbi:MAG: hypothetical protein IPM69_01540 [Ignavibacteria bacterium]|nr:hypothetical protein [Ignavibacteria bacterium]
MTLQEDYIYRLGNYTLLEASINKKLHNEMQFDENYEHIKRQTIH